MAEKFFDKSTGPLATIYMIALLAILALILVFG
jgi:hypothetical protein